jgi:ABC-type nitrate/sulfonate/bicarbonate transport system substrate-binding protein
VDVRDVPTLMALDALETQGYTIEKTGVISSSIIADALARGDADIGSLDNQTMWTAIVKGANVRTIAQRIGSTNIIVSKKEINTCRELDGKSVALQSTKGLYPSLFETFVRQNCPGIKPQVVVITENAGRVAALLAGQIDATFLQSEQLLEVERQAPGRFHVLIPIYTEFSNIQVNGLHAWRDWMEKNPELVKDFLRALLAANRRVYAEPQVLYTEAVRRLGRDPAIAKEVGDTYLAVKLWDVNGGLTKENVQYTIDFLTNIDALPAGLKTEDVADLSYLNAVLEEIGRK